MQNNQWSCTLKNTILMLAALSALTGCSAHYFLDGVKYDNEQAFQAAVESTRQNSLASIQPLSEPLTSKRLIVAIPSEQTIYNENARRHQNMTGGEPTGIAIEHNRNLSKHAFKMNKVFFEGVQKRGIYAGVEIRETDSVVNSLEPASDYDVMYLTEPAVNSGQYFYSSKRHGKQIFAYDRSQPGATANLNNFISAVQALAVRD